MVGQTVILICTSIAIFLLLAENPKLRFYGCIVGLLGQPFWLYSTWHSQQYGMLIVSVWYTLNYFRGIRNNRKKR